MTREEAIEHLKEWKECISSAYRRQVIDMAIEALHREEAEEKGWCHRIRPKNVEVVVRCKDCTNFDYAFNYCDFLEAGVEGEDFFCAYGERKGGDLE